MSHVANRRVRSALAGHAYPRTCLRSRQLGKGVGLRSQQPGRGLRELLPHAVLEFRARRRDSLAGPLRPVETRRVPADERLRSVPAEAVGAASSNPTAHRRGPGGFSSDGECHRGSPPSEGRSPIQPGGVRAPLGGASERADQLGRSPCLRGRLRLLRQIRPDGLLRQPRSRSAEPLPDGPALRRGFPPATDQLPRHVDFDARRHLPQSRHPSRTNQFGPTFRSGSPALRPESPRATHCPLLPPHG